MTPTYYPFLFRSGNLNPPDSSLSNKAKSNAPFYLGLTVSMKEESVILY